MDGCPLVKRGRRAHASGESAAPRSTAHVLPRPEPAQNSHLTFGDTIGNDVPAIRNRVTAHPGCRGWRPDPGVRLDQCYRAFYSGKYNLGGERVVSRDMIQCVLESGERSRRPSRRLACACAHAIRSPTAPASSLPCERRFSPRRTPRPRPDSRAHLPRRLRTHREGRTEAWLSTCVPLRGRGVPNVAVAR